MTVTDVRSDFKRGGGYTVVARRFYAQPTYAINAFCEGGGWQTFIACDCVTREALYVQGKEMIADTPELLDAKVREGEPGAIRCVRTGAAWVPVQTGGAA